MIVKQQQNIMNNLIILKELVSHAHINNRLAVRYTNEKDRSNIFRHRRDVYMGCARFIKTGHAWFLTCTDYNIAEYNKINTQPYPGDGRDGGKPYNLSQAQDEF